MKKKEENADPGDAVMDTIHEPTPSDGLPHVGAGEPDPESTAELGAESVPDGGGTSSTGPTPIEEPQRFKRELLCKLHEEDLAKKGLELARAVTAHTVFENEMKERAAGDRDALKALWVNVEKLSRIVTDGGEQREVECLLIRNDREGSIETVRCDTGEIIDVRAQDAKERQLPLVAQPAGDDAEEGDRDDPPFADEDDEDEDEEQT